MQGAFDIFDEFVEAFGRNADKNIMIMLQKMRLFEHSADETRSEAFFIALEFYDAALNIHSRLLGDDNKSYADILLKKAIKSFGNRWAFSQKELFELFNKCLEILYDDEENNKESIQVAHRYLAFLDPTIFEDFDFYSDVDSNDRIMHGRKAIKLEREMHGEIRRNGQIGTENFTLLSSLGYNICRLVAKASQQLKQKDYDEATGYLLEALAIADPNLNTYNIATTYYALAACEIVNQGKRNLRKALENVEKGISILSKMDETDIEFRKLSSSKKEEIDTFEMLSKLIRQEMMI